MPLPWIAELKREINKIKKKEKIENKSISKFQNRVLKPDFKTRFSNFEIDFFPFFEFFLFLIFLFQF